MKYPYFYGWKNNPKRRELHGRHLRILAHGSMHSILIEFDGGQMEVVSLNAIRKVKP